MPASPLTRLHSEPTEPQKVLCPLVFKKLENENTYITILVVNFTAQYSILPHEAGWQTLHSRIRYRALQLDIELPPKQNPDSMNWQSDLLHSIP